ncbi:hypothetical protein [Conservatibacter flavescens]|uniref:AsmA-like C-terminal domain-containing protein n=1 Tax=Conservatibacter flavescens TaxID=28161 RepID=A0A2M8S042_9PAST|nr:hypothetical protein [Conservatibacter flavescens]PJG84513.1 hypothetical protein CVP05_10860 [Conservatibacter flavescens]
MMKKSVGVLAIFLLLSFGVFFVQKNRLETQLVAVFAQHDIEIQPQDIRLQLFPLVLTLKNVTYRPKRDWYVAAPKADIEFGFFSLLRTSPVVRFIRVHEAVLHSKVRSDLAEFQGINVSLEPTALSVSDLAENNWFKKAFHLDLSFRSPNNQLPVQLAIRNGVLLSANNAIQLHVTNMVLNKAELHDVRLQYTLNNTVFFRSAQGSLDIYAHDSYRIIGKDVEIATVFAALNIDSIMSGKGDIWGTLQFKQPQLPVGKLAFLVHNGKLNGMNLLSMIAQYIPINYDEQALKEKSLDTEFHSATAQLIWQNDHLQVEKLEMTMPLLHLMGTGKMDFSTQQCDFKTTFLPNIANTKLEVPVSFFGDCRSRQYKVEFNRKLQRSLRELLKEHLR